MNRIHLTPGVMNILIACIVFYAGQHLLAMSGQFDLTSAMGLHYFENPDFKPWQIITHMFVHSPNSISHILFNMIGLVSIGVIIENYFGTKKFLLLYFVSGLGSFMLDFVVHAIEMYRLTGMILPNLEELNLKLINDKVEYNLNQYSKEKLNHVMTIYMNTTVGASGAIYGILASFAFFFPNTELMIMFIPYPIKAKYLVPIILGIDLFLGIGNFSWDPIAHYAHIGGALAGLLLVIYWRKKDRRNFY